MIENIKNFQEEFKAKYGVEATIRIYAHNAIEAKDSRNIVNDFSEDLNSNMRCAQSDDTNWFETEKNNITVISFFNAPDKWDSKFLDELSDDAFRGLGRLFTTDTSQEGQEDLVRSYLNAYWERFEREPEFDIVCDVTEVHQSIVRKVYDQFTSEYLVG
jgi:hypothetical protein